MHVLCVGMMVYDVALYPVSPKAFKLEKWDIQPPVTTTGGDALNVAVTLAKLGVPVSVVGRVGNDANGDAVLDISRAGGVDVSGVVRDPRYGTAVSYMLIEENGERHPLSSSQIYEALTAEDVPDSAIEKADLVYFGSAFLMRQMDAGGTLALFRRAHKMGKLTAMDTAMDYFKGPTDNLLEQLSETLRQTDIFIPSFSEARVLTGLDDPLQMAAAVKDLGFRVFGVKLGANGCFLTDYENRYTIGALDGFTALDTTGAGDSFMGAFLCGYLRGWDLKRCGIFANVVASHNVAKVGATNGVPSFEEACAYVEQAAQQPKIITH